MKKLFFFFCLIVLATTVHAQNAVAKIKYEQAEEAFEKSDYAVTLTKLDEAQKILGSTNPKILYLRLMAAKGIVSSGKFDWNLLETARKDAAYYIKQYSEMQGIEEKFRQVYEFSETLDVFPKTKELFDQKLAQAEKAHSEWLKQRPIQVSDSLMNVLGVNECRTMAGFLSSRFSSEFKKNKSLSTKYETWYSRKSILTNYMPAGPWCFKFDYLGECTFYSYILLPKTSDTAAAKKIYQSFLDLYPLELAKESVERKELTRGNLGYQEAVLMIKQPATGNKCRFDVSYKEYTDGALIEITFFLY